MANIYVRKSGSDSNDGSTPALAKLTIAGAFAVYSAGDTIIFGSGLYEISEINATNHCIIYGDITGEYTGDAGEVIFHGLNSSFDVYTSFSNNLFSFCLPNPTTIENIKFIDIKISGYKALLYGNFILNNLTFSNISSYKVIEAYGYALTALSVFISNCFSAVGSLNGISLATSNTEELTFNLGNIIIKDCGSKNSNSEIHGIDLFIINNNATINMKNCIIGNLYGVGKGLFCNAYSADADVITFNVNNVSIFNCVYNFSLGVNGSAILSGSINNCNSFNSLYTDSINATITVTNKTTLAPFVFDKIPNMSIFSPLRGIGNTSFPATDISGNPRPSYGNGAACDIGAVESTSDIIQKESIIKDSGDYSVKVAPCNYFKKTFQVPVTASKLRTVKAKIRIDGTWGTYRPKITLSGQGMTLSTATKNTTTGSFEELTVSGTPSSTGIALLTIEAHSPNTDAAFYIDTITIE